MRIILVHSPAEVSQAKDEHHRRLVREQMQLAWSDDGCELSESVEGLPRSSIVGVALLDDAFWFKPRHAADPWVGLRAGASPWVCAQAVGPFCYGVRDAVTLLQPVPCAGQQGFFTVPDHILPEVLQRDEVAHAIEAWHAAYADDVLLRAAPRADPPRWLRAGKASPASACGSLSPRRCA